MPKADSGMLSQRGKLKRFQHCHLQGPMLAGFVPEGSSDGVQQNKGGCPQWQQHRIMEGVKSRREEGTH